MSNLRFTVSKNIPWDNTSSDVITLVPDSWDDYDFKTTFALYVGSKQIGLVKIATKGMKDDDPHTSLPGSFSSLAESFFSLGQGREYYEKLMGLPGDLGKKILKSLRDVAFDEEIFDQARDEKVFLVSLLRDIPLNTVITQFRRIVSGRSVLTDFRIQYTREFESKITPDLNLEFSVDPESVLPTNLHVIIGGNGVGKSHLFRDFVNSASSRPGASGKFIDLNLISQDFPFANIVHVEYSAFGAAIEEAKEYRDVIKVHSVGLKRNASLDDQSLSESLSSQFRESIRACFKGPKRARWGTAMATLREADSILNDIALGDEYSFSDAFSFNEEKIIQAFESMSSGHQIVTLTMSRLVELVEEKSLVLLDEPETHLHPPLLSAFIRAISDLAQDRNCLAIIATHSPIVLQEVPDNCVWVLRRSGDDVQASRLDIPSFGESVSRLTSEVFRLNNIKTGYHSELRDLLKKNNNSVDNVSELLGSSLGSEGRYMLYALSQVEEGNV